MNKFLTELLRSRSIRIVHRIFRWLIAFLTREHRSDRQGMASIHKLVFEHHEFLARQRVNSRSEAFQKLLNGKRLHYCDVGARGGAPSWLLPFGSSLLVSLFEPNVSEFEQLGEHFGEAIVDRYSFGVGNPTDNTLHITESSGLSSVLKPFGTGWSLMRGDDLDAVRSKPSVITPCIC